MKSKVKKFFLISLLVFITVISCNNISKAISYSLDIQVPVFSSLGIFQRRFTSIKTAFPNNSIVNELNKKYSFNENVDIELSQNDFKDESEFKKDGNFFNFLNDSTQYLYSFDGSQFSVSQPNIKLGTIDSNTASKDTDGGSRDIFDGVITMNVTLYPYYQEEEVWNFKELDISDKKIGYENDGQFTKELYLSFAPKNLNTTSVKSIKFLENVLDNNNIWSNSSLYLVDGNGSRINGTKQNNSTYIFALDNSGSIKVTLSLVTDGANNKLAVNIVGDIKVPKSYDLGISVPGSAIQIELDNGIVRTNTSAIELKNFAEIRAKMTPQSYRVTLNPQNGTSTRTIYYQYIDNAYTDQGNLVQVGYYTDANFTNRITTLAGSGISVTKSYVINLNKNSGNDTVTGLPSTTMNYTYTFNSFNDTTGVSFVDSNLDFTNEVPKGHITLTANYTKPNPLSLPTSFGLRTGYELTGWSTTSSVSDTANPEYAVGALYPKSGEVSSNTTLYAVWQKVIVYTITFDKNNIGETNFELYYKANGKNQGWYKNANVDIVSKVDKLEASNLPVNKTYTVSFNMNGGSQTIPADNTYILTFSGYTPTKESDFNSQGINISNVSYNLNQAVPNKSTTLKANYTAPISKTLKLPTKTEVGTKSGYHFEGWLKINNNKDTLISGDTYDYTDNNGNPISGNTILYAYWVIDTVYTLTLDNSDATTQGEAVIYYNKDTAKWTSDKDGKINITSAIKIPSRTYTITFNPSGGTFSSSVTSTINYSYPFLGYDGYVDRNGNILSSAKLTSSVSIKAKWDETSTSRLVTIPTKPSYNSNKLFKGWSESDSDLTIKVDTTTTSLDPVKYNATTKRLPSTLYAVWHDVYSITFKKGDATNDPTSTIYYNATEKTWYSDASYSTKLNTASYKVNPVRQYQITLNGNGGTYNNVQIYRNIQATYTFEGYKVGSTTIINSNGILVESSSISKNEAIEPTFSRYASFPFGTYIFVKNKAVFKGWSTSSSAVTPNITITQFSPSQTTTLYAVWENSSYATVVLNHDNGTSSRTIYYQIQGDGKNTWYSNSSLTSQITSVSTPDKKFAITFDSNGGGINATSQDYVYSFTSYVNENNTSEMYINSSGNFVKTPTSAITITLKATYTKPSTFALPKSAGTRAGYTFGGWTKIKNDESTKVEENLPNENITVPTRLYALWVKNEVRVLTLKKGDATTSSFATKVYYYNSDTKQWTSDSNGTKPLTEAEKNIGTIKKEYTVTFNLNGGYGNTTSETSITSKAEYTFIGYKNTTDTFVSASGVLDTTKVISNNVELDPSWDANGGLVTFADGKNFKNSKKMFRGWSETVNGAVLSSTSNVRVTGDKTYYAIWRDGSKYVITLAHNGAQSYYGITGKLYYLYESSIQSEIGYYTNENLTGNVITSISIPMKYQTIIYDVNGGTSASYGTAYTRYNYTFSGYKGSASGSPILVDKDGKLSAPSATQTVTAEFTATNSLVLPTYNGTKPNNVYRGWATSKDAITETYKNGASYKPSNATSVSTTLYACWNTVYSVTLSGSDFTTAPSPNKFYYNASTKKWTSDDKGLTVITSITKPQKTYTIKFSANYGTFVGNGATTATYTYVFGGYSLGSTNIVSSTGAINTSASIASDTTLSVITWSKPTGNYPLLTSASVQRSHYTFDGWSTSATVKTTPTHENAAPTDNNKTIYAFWKVSEVRKLTILDTKSTTKLKHGSVEVDSIYYLVSSSISSEVGYYFDENCTDRATTLTPPSMVWTLNYDVNNGTGSVASKTYTYTFGGFKNGSTTYISSSGTLQGIPSVSISIEPTYTQPSNIALPSYNGTRAGFTFGGWTTEKDNGTKLINTEYYNPTKVSDTIYAYWTKYEVYSLTLAKNDATTYAGKTFYYNASTSKWTSDAAGTKELTSAADKSAGTPIRQYTITFNYGTGGYTSSSSSSTSVSTVSYTFDGFKDNGTTYVSSAGTLDTTKALSQNKTLNPSWTSNSGTIVFPGINTLRKSKSIATGWSETSGGTAISTSGIKATANKTYYALWRDANKYTITLNHNGATESSEYSTLYYLRESSITDEIGYYTNENLTGNKITSIKIPTKSLAINYSVNGGSASTIADSYKKYNLTFNGYTKSGASSSLISSTGVLSVPTETQTVVAQFEAKNSMTLPTYSGTKTNSVHLGWATTSEAVTPTNAYGSSYKPAGTSTINFYVCWNTVYSLTLGGAYTTPASPDKFYYNASTKKWTSDKNGQTQITKLTSLPKREYTITFNANNGSFVSGAATTMKYTYTFGGYALNTTSIVDSNGTISSSASISGNSILTSVTWNNPSSYPLIANTSVQRSLYVFNGWSTSSSSKITPTVSNAAPTNNNTVIYANWTAASKYTITIQDTESTTKLMNGSTAVSTLYYVPASSIASEVGYYSNIACTSAYKLTTLTVPKKVWKLNYNVNGGSTSVSAANYTFVFNGFRSGSTTYISQTGALQGTPSGNLTLQPYYTKPSANIALPDYKGTNTGFTFGGWSKTINDSTTQITTSYYNPTMDNDEIFVLWTRSILTITLSNKDATTNGTTAIYFNGATNKFTSDQNGATEISRIPTSPVRAYNFTFNANSGYFGTNTSTTSRSVTATMGFGGYKNGNTTVINADGTINSASATSITSSITLDPIWNSTSIKVPSDVKRSKYLLKGWGTTSTATSNLLSSDATITVSSTPSQTSYYAIWENVKAITFTLQPNNNVSGATNITAYYQADGNDAGWYQNSSLTTSASTSYLTPKDKKVATLTYDLNTGTGTTPAKITNEFTFAGYENTSGTLYFDKDMKLLVSVSSLNSSTITLRARWTAPANKSVSLPSGTGFTKANGVFRGWNTNKSSTTASYAPNGTYTLGSSDVTLYAIWHTVYKLTINKGDATAIGNNASGTYSPLYYNLTTAKWTSDDKGLTNLTLPYTIPVPKREYTVTFNANGGKFTDGNKDTLVQTYTYKLTGYEGGMINASSQITSSSSITKDTTTKPTFVAQADFKFPTTVSNGPHKIVENYRLTSTTGTVTTENTFTATANTTIYIMWRDAKMYKLTLIHNNAKTYDTTLENENVSGVVNSYLYYQYEGTDEYKGWYNTKTSETKFNGKIAIPTRSYVITYNLNGGTTTDNKTTTTQSVDLLFKGYVASSKEMYIKETGDLDTTLIPSADVTITASFVNPDDITLLADTSVKDSKVQTKYFMGWADTEDAVAPKYIGDVKFVAIIDTTIYAVWNKFNKLTLQKGEATTYQGKEIFYNETQGYWSETLAGDKLDAAYKLTELPKRQYNVVYNAATEYVTSGTFENNQKTKTEVVAYTFNGFKNGSADVINGEGAIVTNAKITEDTTLTPSFTGGYAKYSDYTPTSTRLFRGWARTKIALLNYGASSSAIITGDFQVTEDNVQLYSVWSHKQYYTLSFDFNGANATYPSGTTATSKVYYSTAKGMWYTDTSLTTVTDTIRAPYKTKTFSYDYNLPSGVSESQITLKRYDSESSLTSATGVTLNTTKTNYTVIDNYYYDTASQRHIPFFLSTFTNTNSVRLLSSTNPYKVLTLDDDITVKAEFKQSFSKYYLDTVTDTGLTSDIPTLKYILEPASGVNYMFVGWRVRGTTEILTPRYSGTVTLDFSNTNTMIIEAVWQQVEENEDYELYYDSSRSGYVLTKYKKADTSTATTHTIPQKIGRYDVVAIEGNGFFGANKSLQTLSIPATVETIGLSAFENCTSLTTVTFASGSKLKNIKNNAFKECTALTSITIPNGVTTIGDYAFNRAMNVIGTLTIPSSVQTIGAYAFRNMSKLTGLDLSKATQLVSIGDQAFSGCVQVTGTLTIPSSVQTIGRGAFASMEKVSNLTFASSSKLTTIGSNAFYRLGNTSTNVTTKLVIPQSVETIGESAFEGTGLVSVEFASGSKITSIPKNAFVWSTSSGTLDTTLKTVIIPDTITEIGESAFAKRAALTTVTISANSNLSTIGASAFEYCKSLATIRFPRTLTSIGTRAFAMNKFETKIVSDPYYYNPSTGELPFYDGISSDRAKYYDDVATATLTITMDTELLTNIPDYAFTGTGITTFNITSKITSIGVGAFAYCDKLQSLTFSNGNNIRSIGNSAFFNTRKLQSFPFDSTKLTTIGYEAFVRSGIKGDIVLSDTITTINGMALALCENITSITFGKGITVIPSALVAGSFGIKSITLRSESVTFAPESLSYTVKQPPKSLGEDVQDFYYDDYVGATWGNPIRIYVPYTKAEYNALSTKPYKVSGSGYSIDSSNNSPFAYNKNLWNFIVNNYYKTGETTAILNPSNSQEYGYSANTLHVTMIFTDTDFDAKMNNFKSVWPNDFLPKSLDNTYKFYYILKKSQYWIDNTKYTFNQMHNILDPIFNEREELSLCGYDTTAVTGILCRSDKDEIYNLDSLTMNQYLNYKNLAPLKTNVEKLKQYFEFVNTSRS